MNISVLIQGDTGTGKTFSACNLDKTAVILNVERKPLPFKNKGGIHVLNIKNPLHVYHIFKAFSADKDEIEKHKKDKEFALVYDALIKKGIEIDKIKTILLDSFSAWQLDYLYVLRHSGINGYDLWAKYAEGIRNLFIRMKDMEDKIVYLFGHTEKIDNNGEIMEVSKIKGKEWEGVVEREFTIVLYSLCLMNNGEPNYYFLTNRDGSSKPAKSPYGLFDSKLIPNDLSFVNQKIIEFYELQ